MKTACERLRAGRVASVAANPSRRRGVVLAVNRVCGAGADNRLLGELVTSADADIASAEASEDLLDGAGQARARMARLGAHMVSFTAREPLAARLAAPSSCERKFARSRGTAAPNEHALTVRAAVEPELNLAGRTGARVAVERARVGAGRPWTGAGRGA